MASGILNFVRKVFMDDIPRLDYGAESHQVVMPSQVRSNFGPMDYNVGQGSMWLRDYLSIESDLVSRYIDAEEADDIPELSCALDIYADDATQPDGITGKTVRVDCADRTVSETLADLFDKNLRIDEDIWEMARTLCLSEDTMVWTCHGAKKIKDLSVGEEIIGFDSDAWLSRPIVVTEVFPSGSKPVFRIRTKHREVVATADHKFPVINSRGEMVIKKVSDIKCLRHPGGQVNQYNDNLIVACQHHTKEESIDLHKVLLGVSKKSNKGSPIRVRVPQYPDEQFVRLFGFLLGDGFYSATETTHQITFTRGKEDDINDFYEQILKSYGLNVSIVKNGAYAIASSVDFVKFLIALGFKRGAENKRIPEWVFGLNRQLREAFLWGLWDADGWYSDPESSLSRSYHFEMCNEHIVNDLKCLIDGLGFTSGSVRWRRRETTHICGTPLKSPVEAFTITFKKNKLSEGDFATETIVSIEEDGIATTYDINVDSDNRLFVANGVLTHNCKYGNDCEELIVKDGEGVVDLNFLPPPTIRRVEDAQGACLGFIQDWTGGFNISTEEFMKRVEDRNVEFASVKQSLTSNGIPVKVYEPWEVVHMRLRSKQRRALYGYSVLDSTRWLLKRLMLLEDSMLVYRLTRAPERFAFYVDVGDVPPNEALKYVRQVKNDYKKKKWVDPATGRLDMKYNPLCLALGTRIPLLGGEIKTLAELIEDQDRGVKNYTYSIDRETKHIVPGKIVWAGVTRKNASLVKVWLDNARFEIVTPDHKFLMRNGDYVEAQNLKAGDSIMPFNRGINGHYEYVVHPGEAGWDAIEQTHRMVARDKYGDIRDLHVHHEDGNKFNNRPENLLAMTNEEHQRTHGNFAFRNKTAEHSRQVSENNRKYGKGKNIVEYNKSPQHKADNEIRRQAMTEYRAKSGEEHNLKLRLRFSEKFLHHLAELVRSNPNGHADFADFKRFCLHNHKVVKIEWLDYTEDTGCITVEKWHNFALESGVFVKNSADEDFFVPTRGEKRATSIETVGGFQYQGIDDINYFKDKLYAGIKVPKDYLNYSENGASKANLSQEDMRFARSILRVQRELRNGLKKVGRVHLACLGIDPSIVPWEVMLNPPSSIFEMAQMEVRSAQLDLAERYKAFASQYWIQTEILHMTDEEIYKINEMRKKEALSVRYPGFESRDVPRGFLNGNPETQKILKENWETVMKQSPALKKRFDELKGLIQDLRPLISSRR